MLVAPHVEAIKQRQALDLQVQLNAVSIYVSMFEKGEMIK